MATDRSSHAISRRTYLKFGLGAMAGACLTGIVLVPLAEIAPLARDPVTGERVESLLRACPGRSDAVLAGPLCDSSFG